LASVVVAPFAVTTSPVAGATTCPTLGSTSTPVSLTGPTGHTVLDQTSGVVTSATYTNTNTLWDHEDQNGGNGPVVYAHNGNNGNLRATITLSGVHNGGTSDSDWEDITMRRPTGTETVIIADTGDNTYVRTDDQLIAFNEPDPSNGDATVTPTVYPVSFTGANGSAVSPNIEAAAIDQGGASNQHIYLFAKEQDSAYGGGGSGRGHFSVWDVGNYGSLSTTSNAATWVGDIDGISQTNWNNGTRVGPTAADISPDRNYLILMNYQEELVWPRNGTWANTLTTTPDPPCVYALSGNSQYEGDAFSPNTDELYQVKDCNGCGTTTPLKEQSFTP
jgi:hypothetical protein